MTKVYYCPKHDQFRLVRKRKRFLGMCKWRYDWVEWMTSVKQWVPHTWISLQSPESLGWIYVGRY